VRESTAAFERREEAAPKPRRRRWPWIVAGVVVALIVVFHAAGGWYFAGLLRSDGFDPAGPQAYVDATAGPVTDDAITLIPVDDATEPGREGLYGLKWVDGYGQIGEISAVDDAGIVRSFELLEGAAPSPGTEMDVMGWSWPADPARAHGYVYETVQYDSELGPMDAWLVPGTESTWAIYVHGKGVDLREGLRILPTLHEAGMPVMLINYRNDAGQPEDPSGIYHYGQTEWRDLEGAVEFATDAGAERVVLVGASTGGAVISSFLLESDLAKSVDAVVLDSPNLDFGQVVDVEASERSLPGIGLPVPATLTWTAKTIAAVQLGISWDDLDYVSRADEFEVPILVIHGTNDGTVPIETSRRLAEARPDLVTLVETDAGHVLSWNVGPAAYADAIENFLGLT
jgi:hypothetical protein